MEWWGSSPADAFRPNLSYHSLQLASRKKLYDLCSEAQMDVCEYFGSAQILVQPQIAHFCILPANLAALSCIGLTAFLEAKSHMRTQRGLLETFNADFISNAGDVVQTNLSAETLKKIATMVGRQIDNRLLLNLLVHNLGIEAVEMYRAITSGLYDFRRIYSIEQMLSCQLLYGDLQQAMLVELGESIWSDLVETNRYYIKQMALADDHELLFIAKEWHVKLTIEIAKKIQIDPISDAPSDRARSDQPEMVSVGDVSAVIENVDVKFGPSSTLYFEDDMAILAGQMDESLLKELTQLSESIKKATDDLGYFEEAKSHEILEQILRDPWAKTPIEATPRTGSEVELNLDGHQLRGLVYDQALPISQHLESIADLKIKSIPLLKQLNRMLLVSPEEKYKMVRSRYGGDFDSKVLPIYQVTENIYGTQKLYHTPNKRGHSFVVLAADTSSSNSDKQIECLKLLCTAWIGASKNRRGKTEFLAASYDSGPVEGGGHETIVRWIYSHQITEDRSWDHSIARVDAIKKNGGNADVKSWARIMAEAKNISLTRSRLRKSKIYLVIISDCAFNKSFGDSPLPAVEEVTKYLSYLKMEEFVDRLHITVVDLGNNASASVKEVCDIHMALPPEKFQNPAEAAAEISLSLSSAIQKVGIKSRRHV